MSMKSILCILLISQSPWSLVNLAPHLSKSFFLVKFQPSSTISKCHLRRRYNVDEPLNLLFHDVLDRDKPCFVDKNAARWRQSQRSTTDTTARYSNYWVETRIHMYGSFLFLEGVMVSATRVRCTGMVFKPVRLNVRLEMQRGSFDREDVIWK